MVAAGENMSEDEGDGGRDRERAMRWRRGRGEEADRGAREDPGMAVERDCRRGSEGDEEETERAVLACNDCNAWRRREVACE